jgi:hypothetical protein
MDTIRHQQSVISSCTVLLTAENKSAQADLCMAETAVRPLLDSFEENIKNVKRTA